MRILLAVLLAAAALTSGCASSSPKSSDGTSAPATVGPSGRRVETLPLGKDDLALEAGTTYTSPDGFEPALHVTVPGPGWNSTHRGSDAFDIGRPVPGADAALVVVAFLTPQEASTEDALATLAQRAKDAGAKVDQANPSELHVNGGSGPLVTSRDGSIALDAVPDGYATIRAADGPLLTVTWVPDAKNRKQADQRSAQLTAAVQPA